MVQTSTMHTKQHRCFLCFQQILCFIATLLLISDYGVSLFGGQRSIWLKMNLCIIESVLRIYFDYL